MTKPLRILLLEDVPADAELNEWVLRKSGIVFDSLRVDARDAFVAALDNFRPDIILADYHLPGFDGLEALAIAREKMPQVPYIVVSGTLGEDRAVETIRQGATDYILKDRLARLPEAVQRALKEKEAEQQRRETEERYEQLFENMSSGVAIYQTDAAGEIFTFRAINRAVERIDKIERSKLIGRNVEEVFPEVKTFGLLDVLKRVWRSGVAEQLPAALYQDSRVSGWRENYVYRLESGDVVTVYDDVTERIEREAQIKHLNRTLHTVSACNESLVRARSEEELMREVCRHLVETGAYLLACVARFSEGQPASCRADFHFGHESIYRYHAGLADLPEHSANCPTAAVLRSGRAAVCNDFKEASRTCHDKNLQELGVNAILALPLAGKTLYGALTIFSTQPDAFNSVEIKLMEDLAADIAYGITSLRTAAERDLSNRRLGSAMKNTVVALARTLEMRDPYTAGHQTKVAELATAIAEMMQLPPEQIEGIHLAGVVHDIGKIYIPAEILSKPGRLTDLEFNFINAHPQRGYDILKEIEFPWPIAQMVLQHHERMNGSGYPQGLQMPEILLEARILAVADVVEAMSSYRPYRPALGINAALEEIDRNRNTLYDSRVVDACLILFRERHYAFS
ncbi:MAG TPA: HD domain-containing phosphohydrolase [Gallionella sp.]|nr:HD domain-containing phosphohydrolase [Gallionella sp.]